MSIIPKKKFGIAMPIIAIVVVILSIYLPLYSADIIPNGKPNNIANMIDSNANIIL